MKKTLSIICVCAIFFASGVGAVCCVNSIYRTGYVKGFEAGYKHLASKKIEDYKMGSLTQRAE